MFRRRPPRRPFIRRLLGRHPRPPRRPPPGAPPFGGALPPRIRRALVEANRLAAEGRHAEAADIFEHLAEKAEQHGFPIRAAELTLQASRSRFAAGDVDAALEGTKRGLGLLIQSGRPDRVSRLLPRITAGLRERGYGAQADALEEWVEQALRGAGLSLEEVGQPTAQVSERRGTLPAKCDGCGAPLVPDEVEWHDTQTAECPYCGTLAKAV